jgi:hypothetical protein
MENQNNAITIEELSKKFNLNRVVEKRTFSNPIKLANIQKGTNDFKSKISNLIIPDLGNIDYNITEDDCHSELDW